MEENRPLLVSSSHESGHESINNTPHPVKKPPMGGLAVAYFTVFLDTFVFGVILPSLPFFIFAFGGDSNIWLGIIMSSFSVGQAMGTIILGYISDKLGRKPVLIVSLIGSCGTLIATGFVRDLVLLSVVRFIAGLFAGTISLCQAFITDTTPKENRAKFMGFLGACIGLGFVIGPAVGSGLVALKLTFSHICWVSGGLAGVNLILGFFLFKESNTAKEKTKSMWWQNTREAISKEPTVLILLLLLFLFNFAFVGIETTMALILDQEFGIDAKYLGVVFTGIGVVMIIVQIFIHPMVKKFGEKAVLSFGLFVLAASIATVPYMPKLWSLMIVTAFVAMGVACIQPSSSALLSFFASDSNAGTILGVGRGVAAAARAVSPVASGALYGLKVWHFAKFVGFFQYSIAGFLLFVGFLLSFFIRNPRNEKKL